MSTLRKLQPTGTLSTALDAYASAGGVLEYVLFELIATASPQTHREAALLGMDALRKRVEAGPFRLHIHSTPGEPATLSARDFVGPFYDWETASLMNPWANGSRGSSLNGSITHGYADAFLDPPYRLETTLPETNVLFRTINEQLFGGLSAELDIRSWPTDWCNYFDAGLEWWGAFYWTVHSPRTNRFVVIGASTTD